MATKYEEELEKAKLQPEQPKQQKQNALQGMSNTTQQKLATLSQGYTPSQNVTSAQQYLQGIINNKPGQYNSQYAPQITQLYDKMMNRGQFKYDMNADPLYQQYKNSYMNAGKQAMQDTIGNMSALTGGYGNSYAGAAGQQQYQQYLQGLHDVIPTLQQQDYDRYQQEGKDLQNLLAITQGLDETAYGRHRDTVGDWQADRGFAQGAYESAYDREYQDYLNQLNYWQQQGQMENQDYWTGKEYDLTKEQADRNWQMAQNEFDLNKTQAERDWEQAQLQMKLAQGEFGITERSAAFDQAIAMMQMGMTPGAELLAMAGLTEADMQAYLALIRGSGSGGSGGKQNDGSGRTMNKDLMNMAVLGAMDADPTEEQLNTLGLTGAQYANYLNGAMLPRNDITEETVKAYQNVVTGAKAPSSARIQEEQKTKFETLQDAKKADLMKNMNSLPAKYSDDEEFEEIIKLATKGR